MLGTVTVTIAIVSDNNSTSIIMIYFLIIQILAYLVSIFLSFMIIFCLIELYAGLEQLFHTATVHTYHNSKYTLHVYFT